MRPQPQEVETSLTPTEGWHCQHWFYTFDRSRIASFSPEKIAQGQAAFTQILDPQAEHAPAQLQTSIIMGHKADFGIMALDPDPLKLNLLQQKLLASPLGPALIPSYSFTSLTEVSEYVPTVERFGERLQKEGLDPEGEEYKTKVSGYSRRLEAMNKQRLTPKLSDWPATCFYPMNKWRDPAANWYALPFSVRDSLMSEHGRTGMTFAGKVTQLVTVSFGMDDWEWGVTLWATNPGYLANIVYKMRFDEASAKYAEFGPFYVSYITPADEILSHCQIVKT
ncbi:Hemoprotein HemQ, essential component of heme biosynthetic pathway in Gram-positive bacteria [Planctomycetales bacterium 10988]|nr:Hemoprotein HemQ, essential component of heme biosynthetic pathway in Gram-positive bacteria [Planctomycetales bacterium 10988]